MRQWVMPLTDGKPANKEWFTQSDLARAKGVHINTVRNWRKTGVFTAVRLPGGHWRLSRLEFERLTEA